MLIGIALLALAADPLAMAGGMDTIPVEPQTLRSTELSIPVSDSVRAATWDELSIKPSEPVHLRVACIVVAAYGLPGACVPASSISSGSKTVNWPKVRNDSDQWADQSNPAEVSLLHIVTDRLQAVRIPGELAQKTLFVIRFFDEVISPEDARPPFEEKEALAMRDIVLAKPIDASVLRHLYPVLGLRNGVTARVSLACDIQANLKLLCRDQGTTQLSPAVTADSASLIHDFRFATYQFASTIQLNPKDISGNGVIGRQLKFAIVWKLP